MSVASPAQTVSLAIPPPEPLPWSMWDAWLGLGIAVVITIGAAVAVVVIGMLGSVTPLLKLYAAPIDFAVPVLLELIYLVPVLAILAWRRASLLELGFRKFPGQVLGIGCGLTMFMYMVIMVYGAILVMLKIETQGDMLLQVLKETKSPAGLVVAAVLAAPLAEEMFFRGFLFQGLRQRFGWNKAALLSAAAFSAMHLQLASLLPTFLMGYLFAFVYNRSNSLWPSVILHFLINSFGMCAMLAVLLLPAAH
jgi:membrane protease YdiL (CAAX protease family)